MSYDSFDIINKLESGHRLPENEYGFLISEYLEGKNSDRLAAFAMQKADKARRKVYGNSIFIRGLIEFSSFCKNDCYYCGIRRSNNKAERYRLSEDEILECCTAGYGLGFRTFVLQGGEDPYFSDEHFIPIIKKIKTSFPDCALTISAGERSEESFKVIFDAGADRYLLRHETADKDHYAKLHPSDLSLENRLSCLNELKKIGFQTGCGFLVGSPYQTANTLAKDLMFVQAFHPAMCGIGPFIPHNDTPFAKEKRGDVDLTIFLISILRLIHPEMLIPATTALGSADESGREKGILAGANVVMPNLSPESVRKKYNLYNGKKTDGDEAAERLESLRERIKSIGFEVVIDRGDVRGADYEKVNGNVKI